MIKNTHNHDLFTSTKRAPSKSDPITFKNQTFHTKVTANKNFIKNLIFLMVFFLFPLTAFSQTVPQGARAGVLEPVKKKERSSSGSVGALPQINWSVSDSQLLKTDQKIFVQKFVFSGNTVFKNEILQKFTEPYIGKNLSFEELKEITSLITGLYRENGFFLAKAFFPTQEIAEGVITIQLIEGQLGQVKIQYKKVKNKKRVEKIIRKYFEPEKENLLHYQSLLKSILIINEGTYLTVRTILQQGKEPQTVDLVLFVEQKDEFEGVISYDNHGSRFVSEDKFSIAFEKKNVLLAGDRLSFTAGTGVPLDVLNFAQAEYSYGLNASGTRMNLGYSWLDSDVQGQFRPLGAGGKSEVYQLNITHPIVKKVSSKTNVSIGFQMKESENFILGNLTSEDKLRIFTAGLRGDFIDGLKGKNFYSFVISVGLPGFWGGLESNDSRSSRVGAGGEFQKVNVELNRIQKLTKNSSLVLKGSFQVASDTLPASEQFSVGGASSVRGFPVSESLGDHGVKGSVELNFLPKFLSNKRVPLTNKKFKDVLSLAAFVDYGRTFLKNPILGENKDQEILGAGIGASINFSKDFNLEIDVGFPIGGQDASDDSNVTTYIRSTINF